MPKERQTCTECSMRRQKCDRQLPCSRCVKRGDADKCTREWPSEGYDPKIHRTYPRPTDRPGQQQEVDERSPSLTTQSPGNRPTASVESDASLHPSLRTPASSTTGHHHDYSHSSPQSSSIVTTIGPQQGTGAPDSTDGPPNTVLKLVGWGREPMGKYNIKPGELENARPRHVDWDWDYSNGFGNTSAAQIDFLQMLLPEKKQVFQLVDYHLDSILWYHASFHGTTFRRELSEYYSNPHGFHIRDTDLRWSAILFAVMAASMTCASDQEASSWGFQKGEGAKLTRQWFKATLCCLNLADYMWRHHIFSIQAIEVLTMSAHILGFSNTQSTLLGAALKIAQGLGLQRMSADDDQQCSPDVDLETREKILRREMGRRMWVQLCLQDWFSIPFSEMYTIQRNQFSTPLPEYLNDETLEPLSSEVPTVVTFSRCMANLAQTFSQCHDAITEASTLYTKYEEVLKFETKIKATLAHVPAIMDINKPLDPSWPRWVAWARRSLVVCTAHKVIMVHRQFLGRSFTEQHFSQTRDSCMNAAKTILHESGIACAGDGPMLWIDQAFVVASGITLSLDLFHRKSDEPLFEDNRKHVQHAIKILQKYENSMIAIRGIRLLSQLLAEQARLVASQKLNWYKRGREVEGSNGSPNTTSTTHNGDLKRPRRIHVPSFIDTLGKDDGFPNSLRMASQPQNSGRSGTPDHNAGPMSKVQFSRVNGDSLAKNDLMYPTQIGATIGAGAAFPTMPPAGAMANPAQFPIARQPVGAAFDYYNQQQQPQLQQLSQYPNTDLGFETFEQLFPPQLGYSNELLFEDLLNFDLQTC